jgi:hypothetical protein
VDCGWLLIQSNVKRWLDLETLVIYSVSCPYSLVELVEEHLDAVYHDVLFTSAMIKTMVNDVMKF